MVIMGIFGLMALAAVGVLSGVIPLPKSAEENISGTVVAWGTLDPQGFQFVENTLKVVNKNISFQYIQKPLATFDTVLNEAIASGRGPDIIIISQEQILRNKSKIAIQNITSDSRLAFRDAYINGAELFLSEEGMIGYPLAVNPLVMYYNDRLLTSGGFAKPPQFWDELQTYVDVLTVKNDNRDIRGSALALGTFENITYPLDILSALILQTGTAIVQKETRYDNQNRPFSIYISDLGTTQTNQVLEFFNAFSNPNKKLYSWNISLPQDIDAFTSEFSTFWFGYPTDESRIQAKNPNLNYKITSLPQIRNSRTRLTYGKIYGVSVLKSAPNIQAANIVQRLLSEGDIQQIIVEDTNLQYPFRSIPASALATEKGALFARQAIQVSGYFTPSYDFTYTLFKNVLNQIASGSIDTNAGVQRLESELNNFISRNQL